MNRRIYGITLIELIIAIVLISVVIIGLSSIDLFSRHHVITSDRRAKMQNQVSYVLEHMSKEAVKTIGNSAISGQEPVDLNPIDVDVAIKFYLDLAADGQSPGDGRRDENNPQGDRWIAYRFHEDTNQIWYCPECNNVQCRRCRPRWSSGSALSGNIADFAPDYASGNNYVDIRLTACWDPDGTPDACGTPDNPSVNMRNRIKMPSVSTN